MKVSGPVPIPPFISSPKTITSSFHLHLKNGVLFFSFLFLIVNYVKFLISKIFQYFSLDLIFKKKILFDSHQSLGAFCMNVIATTVSYVQTVHFKH